MKRVISMVTVVLLCIALAVPAFATEVDFVPSITAKPAPSIKTEETVTQEDGTVAPIVNVKNEENEVVYSTVVTDLIVTPVADVQEENAELGISTEAAEALKKAYEVLSAEDLKITEEVPELVENLEAAGYDSEKAEAAVVTALFDVTVLSKELQDYLDVEGNTIELTFEVIIPENHHVVVMVYKNDQWQLIENVVDNGDGTITCTFAHFCPVAVLTVPVGNDEDPTEPSTEPVTEPATDPATEPTTAPVVDPTEPAGSNLWWVIVLIAAVVVVIILVAKKKGKKEDK